MHSDFGYITFYLHGKVYYWDLTDQHDCSYEPDTGSYSGSSDRRDGSDLLGFVPCLP